MCCWLDGFGVSVHLVKAAGLASPSMSSGAGVEAEGDVVSPLRSQVRFGTVPDFTLDITEDDISLLSASISSPSGQNVSCLLKRQPDSHIGQDDFQQKWSEIETGASRIDLF